MSLESSLRTLGFTKNDITVYTALLALGTLRAGALIDETGLHRNIVYTSLANLARRGYVTKITRGGVAEFSANSPDRLLEEIDEKKHLAQDAVKELKKTRKETHKEVGVFEGREGLERVRNRTLAYPKGETMYVLGASGAEAHGSWESYWRAYHAKRAKKGIRAKLLYAADTSPNVLASRRSYRHTETRYLPFAGHLPVQFAGIGDHFEIEIPGKDPLTFFMKSKEAVDGLKAFFDYLWHQEVRVETGMKAIEETFYRMLDDLSPEESYDVLGASMAGGRTEYRPLFTAFHRARVKKGVAVNMFASHEYVQAVRDMFAAAGDPDSRISHVKQFVSPIPQPFQINLYHGKTKMIVYGKEPSVLSFDRPEIFQGFKTYFNAMWHQEYEIRRGASAVRDLWLEAIDAKELRLIGARGYFLDRFSELFKTVEDKARQTRGIVWKIATDPGVRGHRLTQLPWSKTKYVLPPVKHPNVVWLFGDTIAVANWTDKEPIVFVSTNPFLFQSYSDYFDTLWGEG